MLNYITERLGQPYLVRYTPDDRCSLEHELISNRHTCDMVGSIGLNGRLKDVALACVRSVISINDEITEENLHVDLGLLDGFKLSARNKEGLKK
jgi:hypothetical protein